MAFQELLPASRLNLIANGWLPCRGFFVSSDFSKIINQLKIANKDYNLNQTVIQFFKNQDG